MKKSLLALAVLGAFAGAASAQSSVTLFGVVDLSANYLKNGSTTTKSIDSNQLNSNRLGFRGIEDLGGGLKAGFWLEAGMDNASGFAGGGSGNSSPGDATTANQGQLFNRRSTVSLIGNFGEVRIGRDYDPTFWNQAYFDVDGANGLGEGLNLVSTLGSGASTLVRANNSVDYFLPANLGGIYGQFMASAGENTNGARYDGGRLGYATGPFDIAVAYSITKTVYSNDDFKVGNIGASWDFGVVKVFALAQENKWGAAEQKMYELSASVPLGQGEFRASGGHQSLSGTNPNNIQYDANGGNSSKMYSVEYIYNLSKRTALYTTAARISNSGPLSGFAVLNPGFGGSAVNTASTGYNVGIRHSF